MERDPCDGETRAPRVHEGSRRWHAVVPGAEIIWSPLVLALRTTNILDIILHVLHAGIFIVRFPPPPSLLLAEAQHRVSMASPTAAASTGPPYYLLISHSQCLNNASVPTSTSLSHPVIEYHYADDAPASLLPQHAGEHVLVLDYDLERSGTPIVKSLSPDLVVSALKVADAPGAAVVGESAMANNSMYVIETMPRPTDKSVVSPHSSVPSLTRTCSPAGEGDEQNVHAVLTQFKQR